MQVFFFYKQQHWAMQSDWNAIQRKNWIQNDEGTNFLLWLPHLHVLSIQCLVMYSTKNQLVSNIDMSCDQLVKTCPRYLVVEYKVDMIHHYFKHLGHISWITSQKESRYLCERATFDHVLKCYDKVSFHLETWCNTISENGICPPWNIKSSKIMEKITK